MKGTEIGSTMVVANAQFAVQDGRQSRKLDESVCQASQASCPLSAALREGPDVIAVFHDQKSIPVPFRLMRPARPLGWGLAENGTARVNKGGA